MKNRKYIITLVMMLLAVVTNAQNYQLESAINAYNSGDYKTAAVKLRPLAEGGNAEAQYIVAHMFAKGLGVIKSPEQSKKYMTLSAEKGFMPAIEYLVESAKNTSEAKEAQTAKKYYEMFPEKCDGKVAATLAMAYANGTGLEQDFEKAIDIALKSTSEDFPERTKTQVMISYLQTMLEKWNIDKEDVAFYDSIYAVKPEVGEYMMRLNFKEFSDGGGIMKLYQEKSDGQNPTWAAILAMCYYQGWGGLLQHHNQANFYANFAVARGSQMGKYIYDKYSKMARVGFYFNNGIVFELKDEKTWGKVFSRKDVACKANNIDAQLEGYGYGWRVPTKKEMPILIKYWLFENKFTSNVNVWVASHTGSRVIYRQTYNPNGELIQEEPYHNHIGSSYEGQCWLIPVAAHK